MLNRAVDEAEAEALHRAVDEAEALCRAVEEAEAEIEACACEQSRATRPPVSAVNLKQISI